VITLADLVPTPPVLDQWSSVACALDFPTYSVIDDDLDIEYYTWTVMPSGVPLFPNGSNNNNIEVNWQGFSGGTICVTGTNDCGEGPPTCFDVMVIPSPIADFNMPTTAWVDSAVTIMFSGTASMDASFVCNFGSGATIHSGGTGRGPHMISWGAPGVQTVTLQVAETGCDTSDISFQITVEALGQPVVSCTSTLNSITFEWEPVPGAGSYTVNVLQGPTGSIVADTSYVVTGLAPGTVVEIQVVALGLGACAQQTATLQCVAQSCPPKMIMIQIPNDSFCIGNVTGVITLSVIIDGSPGTGVWSGPGVDPLGTFDPVVAGVGQHQIVFMHMEGTCNYQRSITVYVLDTPTAAFTVDMAICQSSTAAVQYTGTASVNAGYTWNFGGATVVAGTGSGPYTLRWNSPGMYSISLMVEENNCPSTVVTQMIDVQPTLTAPTIQCFPTTSSVAIQWGTVPNATSYNVTHLFGTMGVVNGNRYEVNGLMPGDSVAISITVSNSGLCPPVVVVASCVAQDCPMPTFVIDPVNDICLYPGTGTVDLNVTVTNGTGSGTWSGTGITDVNQGIFDPVAAGPGQYIVSYDYSDMGCSFTETTTIDVYGVPTALISNASLILTCDNGNQLVLDGGGSVAPGTITYLWSTSDGAFIGATNQATTTVGAPGTYDLLIVDAISGCEDMVSVTVMQDDGVPVADAGPDKLLNCNINSVVIGGSSSAGPGISYLWSTSGGAIASDPTSPTITVTAGGVYDLMVTDSNNGCESFDQASVTVDTIHPTGVINVADILDCDTEMTTVSATITPAGGTYTYSWVTTTGQILSGGSSSTITVDRAAMYTLYVTSQVNGCSDTLSAQVLADDDVISDLQTMVDAPDCVGDFNGSVAILQVVGGNTPYTYAWSNQATGTSISNLGPGTYTVTVSDINGCKYTETFTLPAPVAINPDIGQNLRVNVGEIVTLVLTVADSGSIASIIWEGVAPPCQGCFTNVFTGEASGDILVTVIDSNDCEASASIRLTVFRPKHIFVPNVFSPNGDGVNDLFKVEGNTIVSVLSLRIFDRWGGLVYERYGLNPADKDGWDGTFNGKELNPGVYVYRAELLHDDERMTTEVIRGDITLVR
jgi:gliding motility-associated-like protein